LGLVNNGFWRTIMDMFNLSGDAIATKRVAYTLDEAAEALRISRSTAKTMIGRGVLRVTHLGRRVIVPADEVDRIIREGAPLENDHLTKTQ
jgi:excisionase family DNA binding protein